MNSLLLLAVGTALLVHGFSGPNPWLFYFLHGHWARVSSTKSNDFNANFSFGISAAVHPWNQLNFYVTGFKNTQACRDIRSCHFHAQLESSITLLSTDSVALALSRASSCRLNDAVNVMSFLHGSDISRLLLHTTNICQCTHEFSRVSGHFTHRWTYRHVYQKLNSLVVKVSKLIHFRPGFGHSHVLS